MIKNLKTQELRQWYEFHHLCLIWQQVVAKLGEEDGQQLVAQLEDVHMQQPHCQTYGAGNPLCATRRLVKLLQYYRRFAYFLRFLAVPQIWVPVALRQEGYSTGRRLSSWL